MQRPVLLSFIGLIVLSSLGTAVLCQPFCTPRDARESEYFLSRVIAECAFDSISAACGSGLVAGPLEKRYSPAGLWVLWCVGVLSALLYLLCFAAVIRGLIERVGGERAAADSPPPAAGRMNDAAAILLAAVGLFSLLAALIYVAGRAVCPTVSLAESAWLTGSAFFSLGLVQRGPDAGTSLMLGFVGLLGACGWMLWLLPLRRFRARQRAIPVGRIAAAYLILLAGAGALVCGLEQPRGGESIGKLSAAPEDGPPALSRETSGPRYLRSAAAVVNAASTGIASEPLTERGLRDGSKAVLASVMLLGGLLGGPGGGLTLTLLALACLRQRAFWGPLAARAIFALGALTIGLTLVLLLLEAQVASRYQPPPTFADALVDAASAVGGGGLTSGLTGTLLARNLVSGIGLGLSQYQIGMLALAVGMVAGRLVPLALCASYARRRQD